MPSFSAKNKKKLSLAGEEKNSKTLKKSQKFPNYFLQLYQTSDQKVP